MTTALRYYRDQTRRPCVQAEEEHIIPADYLESDLQDSATATEVLAVLDKVPAQGEQSVSGNAYTAVMSADQVILESLFEDDEDIYRMPVPKFQLLLSSWIEFLDNDGLISIVPEF